MKKSELKKFDQRTNKFYISQGIIKENDYNKFIDSLPDNQDNFELIPFEKLEDEIPQTDQNDNTEFPSEIENEIESQEEITSEGHL